ncbi:hypothetical protein NE555_17590, partial [Alistipes onderdonkii]|nr:hypothetical protein [Alistipes onderdonkii]
SPLGDGFDAAYFDRLVAGAKPNLSAKAFLATEQRIPGLGNGAPVVDHGAGPDPAAVADHDGARIGKGCRIHTAASVSCLPQDLKFAGEVTTAEIG